MCLCLLLLRIVDITNALASVQFSAFAESGYFRFCCGFQMFCIIAQIYLFECFESQPPSIHYIIPAKSWCDRVNHSRNGLAVFICKNIEWLKKWIYCVTLDSIDGVFSWHGWYYFRKHVFMGNTARSLEILSHSRKFNLCF